MRSATTSFKAVASRRRTFTSSEVAARAVSPALASGEIVIAPLLPQGLAAAADVGPAPSRRDRNGQRALRALRVSLPLSTDGTSAALSSGDGRDGRAAEDRLRFATGAAAVGHDGNAKAPQVWFAEALKALPRQQGEQPDDYARRLYQLMQVANLTKPWSFGTLKRRLYDRLPDDKPAR